MKLPTFALLALLLASTAAQAGSLRLTGNKSVAVEISLADTVVAAGDTITMAVRFRPVEGIHINLQPPLDFKRDTSSGAALAGSLVLPKGEPYLNTNAPVVQRFVVPRGAKPGRLSLNGMLTYFYCSDKEGWCSKYKQPVELSVTVRR
jgi:hypothetical protein